MALGCCRADVTWDLWVVTPEILGAIGAGPWRVEPTSKKPRRPSGACLAADRRTYCALTRSWRMVAVAKMQVKGL
jgi:hypothetical protein